MKTKYSTSGKIQSRFELFLQNNQGGFALMESDQMNRRQFMGVGAKVTALGVASRTTLLLPRPLQAGPAPLPPSERVRFASIGTGVEGCTIMQAALQCPGTEVVAACDLYDGRLTAAKEYAKKDIFTTKDYRAVLDRKDVDAVLVATPDHWHARITGCLRGGQGCLLRKTHVAHRGAGFRDDRCHAEPPAHRSGGQP